MKRWMLVGLLAFAASSCNSSTSPSSNDISGSWSGPVSDTTVGAGTLRATLAQSGSSITGTWSSTYANAANNNAGQITGSRNGSSVSLTASPSNPTTCPFTATLNLSSATSMSGTYATFNCTLAISGTINVAKQ